MTKKTVAITGGTGHLGVNLIKTLLKRDFKVKALTRNPTELVKHAELTWIVGDLLNTASLSTLIDGCDAVVHCASAISLGEMDHTTVYEVNVKGTEQLLKQCLGKPIRFVHISSSTVTLSSEQEGMLNENLPYRSDKSFYYAFTKAEAEKIVLNYVHRFDIDAFILRPTAIIGPEDHAPSRFGRTILDLHHGKLPFITSGGYNMVDVRDLSTTIVNSFDKAKKGAVYLTGGHFTSLKELANLACPKHVPLALPIDLMLFLLPVITLYDRFFPLKWPLTKESLSTLKTAPRQVNSEKAVRELDHKNRAIEVSVKDLINWFNENKRT